MVAARTRERGQSKVGSMTFFHNTSLFLFFTLNGKVKATNRTRTLHTEKTARGRVKVRTSTLWADQSREYDFVLQGVRFSSQPCFECPTYHSCILVGRYTPFERSGTLYPHPTFGPTILLDPLSLTTIPAAQMGII